MGIGDHNRNHCTNNKNVNRGWQLHTVALMAQIWVCTEEQILSATFTRIFLSNSDEVCNKCLEEWMNVYDSNVWMMAGNTYQNGNTLNHDANISFCYRQHQNAQHVEAGIYVYQPQKTARQVALQMAHHSRKFCIKRSFYCLKTFLKPEMCCWEKRGCRLAADRSCGAMRSDYILAGPLPTPPLIFLNDTYSKNTGIGKMQPRRNSRVRTHTKMPFSRTCKDQIPGFSMTPKSLFQDFPGHVPFTNMGCMRSKKCIYKISYRCICKWEELLFNVFNDLSQWRECSMGLIWHDLEALTTVWAREFWIRWREDDWELRSL